MRLLLLFIECAPTVAEVDAACSEFRVNDTFDKRLKSNLSYVLLDYGNVMLTRLVRSLPLLIVVSLLVFGAGITWSQRLVVANSTYWGSYNAKDYGAVGNGSTDDTAAIQSCIIAAYNAKVQTCYLPPTGHCYKTTRPIYLADPSFSSNISNPTTFNFSLALVGEEGGANHEGFGSRICPSFNNGVALWVGPGQGMVIRGLEIIGPQGGYRGNQNRNGIGVAIAGGNGGAHRTVIENVEVDNFYTCFSTGTNFDSLGDPIVGVALNAIMPIKALTLRRRKTS